MEKVMGSLYTFPRRLFWRRWQPKLSKLSQNFLFDLVQELSDTPRMAQGDILLYVILQDYEPHTHITLTLQITFCNKLKVRGCFRHHWNQNDSLWICDVCLWKVQFISFQSDVCKNTIFPSVYKLTSFHSNHKSQVVDCANLTCSVLYERKFWICAFSITIRIKIRFH
jgi:hypothetical protein